jgi:hypothetical protein
VPAPSAGVDIAALPGTAGPPEPKPVKAGSIALDEERQAGVATQADGAGDARAVAASKPVTPLPPAQVEGPAPSKLEPESESLLASAESAARAARAPQAPQRVPEVNRGVAAAAPAPAPPSGLKTLGLGADEPIVGQLVRVLAGDTLWDIAVAYYGTAGPVTLKRILNSNPAIRDPRHLEVGAHIYLPFQRPEQMVLTGEEGSYRILLAVSPEKGRLAPVRAWIESFIGNAQFTTSTVSGAERSYHLHLVGLASREAALEFANEILTQHDQLRRSGGRRSA